MGLLSDLHNAGVGTGYQKYVLELEPILEGMGKRGMPVSPATHAEVTAKLEEMIADCEGAMQTLIPDEVRACHPKSGYKKVPKDTTGMVQRDFPVYHKDPKLAKIGVLDNEKICETRWCRLDPWKPSRDGLIRYMRHMNHSIPTNYKTGKQTTVEDEIERLLKKTRDPLYAAVLQYRQVGTVLNNHLANWAPSEDARVHPVFYYDTGTGQLASRRPNAQNAPKHGEVGSGKKELANLFRSMVQARPGHTLVEFDYRSFHAQTLAFEARDKDYMRLAKLDIHSYLTAHLVRHPERDRLLQLPDEVLKERLAEIKGANRRIRDERAKRAILGYGFGMGWRKLYMMNRDSFSNMGEAKQVMDTLNGLFPRACQWRDKVRQQAHDQGYLLSRYGCIRWFWEVFKWDGTKWAAGGDDSEAAVAFLPANDAFCHIKDAMRRLNALDALNKYQLINQIHDALMFEIPDVHLQEALCVVSAEMSRPSEVLVDPIVAPTGLSVEVGISLGKSWDKMEEAHV